MSEMPCSVLAIRMQKGVPVCGNKLGCLCHKVAFPPFYQVDLSEQGTEDFGRPANLRKCSLGK